MNLTSLSLDRGKLLRSFLVSATALVLIAGSAAAVTTISTNVDTDGDLTVDGSATLGDDSDLDTHDINGEVFLTREATSSDETSLSIFHTNNSGEDNNGTAMIWLDNQPGSHVLEAGLWITNDDTDDPINAAILLDGGTARFTNVLDLNGTLLSEAELALLDGLTGAIVDNSLTDNAADALDIQEGSNNYVNVDTSDGSETMAFGNATTNPDFSFLGSGAVSVAGTLAVGGGTDVTEVIVASQADGANGWDPDGATASFVVTANAASVEADSHITVSLGANTAAVVCGVSTKTATTSFTVSCTGNPDNGATLEYMIVNF